MQCMYGCMYAVCMYRPTYVCIYIIHADGPCTGTCTTPYQGRMQDFWKGGGSRRGYRISWKGGGEDSHNKHPPTSSALRKIENHPHSLKFTSTPPLGHCPRDVIRPQINWKTPPTPTLGHSQAPPPWTLPVWRHPHSKGGGVITPVTHTHPASATWVLLMVTV